MAAAGGSVALEAAWRALLELSRPSIDIVRRRLAGEVAVYAPPGEAVRQLEHFVESLSLETLDLGAFERRLVRICHALDHLNRLHIDLRERSSVGADFFPPSSFAAGAQAFAAWLDTTRDPAATVRPEALAATGEAAQLVAEERRAGRDKLLEDVALQRVSTGTARNALETLGWAERAVYQAWRLTASLQAAANGEMAAEDGDAQPGASP